MPHAEVDAAGSSVEDGGDNNDAVVGNNNKVSATLGVGEESLPLPASSTEERLVELPRNRLSAAVDGILPSTSTPSSDAETEAKTNSNRRLTTIDDILSLKKFTAEALPEETKTVLGWLIDAWALQVMQSRTRSPQEHE